MLRLLSTETVPVRTEPDIAMVRRTVRERATELGFGLFDLTKLVTAASELGRNALTHGGGGTMVVEVLADDLRRGLRLIFEDHGPGIPDLELAMTDGYTTLGGMGLGLSGSKRLVQEFEIVSQVGEGTRVTVTRWM